MPFQPGGHCFIFCEVGSYVTSSDLPVGFTRWLQNDKSFKETVLLCEASLLANTKTRKVIFS